MIWGAGSNPTVGSVQFQAVSIVLNNENRPELDGTSSFDVACKYKADFKVFFFDWLWLVFDLMQKSWYSQGLILQNW